MATVLLRGVQINFPFEPYEIQKEYMEKVLECLQNETNGVLESPTGTGKTLSLLCASLAWLELKKAQVQIQRQAISQANVTFIEQLQNQLNDVAGKPINGRTLSSLPTIIYASRTHSQLSQAMQELKRTSYSHMKACVLGSRDQLCIHPELMKEQNSAFKVQMCQLKVKTRSCQFHGRVDKKKMDPCITDVNVMDIEDLVKLGNLHKFCPFFMAKELKQQADIIFLPYNYLLDPKIREVLGIELNNAVVIFDEGHNVEKMCEEAASLQIKSSDITLAIDEVTAIMKVISEDVMSFDDTPKDFSAEDLCSLKQMLLDLEHEIDNIPLSNQSEGTTLEGTFMFELLSKAGVNNGNFNNVIALITNIVQYLTTVSEGPFSRRGNSLKQFADVLTVVFSGVSEDYKQKIKQCYKVHVQGEEIKKGPSTWLSKNTAKSGGRVLNYWCFSPGFGMNMLASQGLRCLILTSGTLAPLKPLISELQLNVGVRLENPHIVKGDQVCVKIVTAGPDMEVLNCNFQNRDNPKYIASLGRSILNLTRVIPNGLLIFFPSYPIMLNCRQSWQETGIWTSINAQKAIYVEPRDKTSFNSTMCEYYQKIQDPNLKGAIFMGVCRGKVSEGLDFADANGRAVIITGLPYPPLKDPRIVLKKQYLNLCNARDKEFLKGDEWYSLEASRAVNQAIGRVIRHQNDYGAILLLDTRFNNFRFKNQISLWLRDHIRVVDNFGELMRDLGKFFKNADAKAGSSKMQPKTMSHAEFEVPKSYKSDNFDFSTSSVASSNSTDDLENGEIVIHKRAKCNVLSNPSKRMKINLIPNSSKSSNSVGTSTKEYTLMVKKSLDAPAFGQFIDAMKHYKETDNFVTLKNNLDNIFRNKYHLRYLIPGLESFIKDHHKVDFTDYCDKNR